MNKGFTLVELLAIISILALIFLVSFPNFMSMTRKDEAKKYEEMEESLCLAGKTYIYNHMEEYTELSTPNSIIEIQIQDLIDYEIVENDLKNPNTNKYVKNYKLKYKVLQDQSLDCKYIEE